MELSWWNLISLFTYSFVLKNLAYDHEALMYIFFEQVKLCFEKTKKNPEGIQKQYSLELEFYKATVLVMTTLLPFCERWILAE